MASARSRDVRETVKAWGYSFRLSSKPQSPSRNNSHSVSCLFPFLILFTFAFFLLIFAFTNYCQLPIAFPILSATEVIYETILLSALTLCPQDKDCPGRKER